jgi:hypothetical protein
LDQALTLPYGFAGFRAPACLTLAEAVQVGRPGDQAAVQQALDDARRAAHNIQDYTFCAVMTARVNAMRLRWWNEEGHEANDDTQLTGGQLTGSSAVDVAQRLAKDPKDRLFSAAYVIGEDYAERTAGPQKLPLPDDLFHLDGLDALSQRLFAQSRSALRNANPDLTDAPLSPGTAVNIPDPVFTPLLAARLAAEVLAQGRGTSRLPVQAVQALVPQAITDPTALDTVLARLLLLDGVQDPALLNQLDAHIDRYMPDVSRQIKTGPLEAAQPLGPKPATAGS